MTTTQTGWGDAGEILAAARVPEGDAYYRSFRDVDEKGRAHDGGRAGSCHTTAARSRAEGANDVRARLTGWVAAAATVLAATSACATPPASAAPGGPGCEQAFAEQYRTYDAAFERRDVTGFMSFYREDATKIDQDGSVYRGRPAIEGVFDQMFRQPFTATFIPTSTTVVDCRTAFVVLDASVSAQQFSERFFASMTFTADEQGRWKVLSVVSTKRP